MSPAVLPWPIAGSPMLQPLSTDLYLASLPGTLSCATILAFISGSSFVLIDVRGMPTRHCGYRFAFGTWALRRQRGRPA